MTPNEYRTILTRLGLSQVGAARLLGVDERTSRRWARGDRDVPPPVERFLRYLSAADVQPEEVLRVLSRA